MNQYTCGFGIGFDAGLDGASRTEAASSGPAAFTLTIGARIQRVTSSERMPKLLAALRASLTFAAKHYAQPITTSVELNPDPDFEEDAIGVAGYGQPDIAEVRHIQNTLATSSAMILALSDEDLELATARLTEEAAAMESVR